MPSLSYLPFQSPKIFKPHRFSETIGAVSNYVKKPDLITRPRARQEYDLNPPNYCGIMHFQGLLRTHPPTPPPPPPPPPPPHPFK